MEFTEGLEEPQKEDVIPKKKNCIDCLCKKWTYAATFNEVDMTEIFGIRNHFKEKFKDKYGIGLGFMSFFTKETLLP